MPRSRQRQLAAAAAGAAGLYFGALWDIAWHVDIGRDRFLTPPHLVIATGIALVGAAAVSATLLVRGDGGFFARRMRARPGMVLAGTSALLQGVALAVDNWWHGVFGQDVTLWSPPHVLLMALGVLAGVGILLDVATAPGLEPAATRRALLVGAGGLLGMGSLFLAEYDFGVPHFSLAWSAPVLGAALGLGLAIGAEVDPGRWAGTAVAAVAIGVRVVAVFTNATVGRSLIAPPIGLLAGGLAFDIARRRMRLEPAVVVAWLATALVQAPWLRAAGKTWWPAPVLPLVVVGGAAGAVAAAVIGRSVGRRLRLASGAGDHTTTPAHRRPARRLAATASAAGAVVVLVLLTVAAAPPARAARRGYVDISQLPTRAVTVVARGSTLRVHASGTAPGDWVTVMGAHSTISQGATWQGGASRGGRGWFTVHLRRTNPNGYIVWLVSGDAAWSRYVGTGRTPAGTPWHVRLAKAGAFNALTAPPHLKLAGYALVVVILGIGLAVTRLLLDGAASVPPSHPAPA